MRRKAAGNADDDVDDLKSVQSADEDDVEPPAMPFGCSATPFFWPAKYRLSGEDNTLGPRPRSMACGST